MNVVVIPFFLGENSELSWHLRRDWLDSNRVRRFRYFVIDSRFAEGHPTVSTVDSQNDTYLSRVSCVANRTTDRENGLPIETRKTLGNLDI